MIKLSRLTDYAIVLLTQMTLEGKGIHAASVLAEKTFLPLPTVSKVLKQLTKAGVITAQRGAAGGYTLAQGDCGNFDAIASIRFLALNTRANFNLGLTVTANSNASRPPATI